MHCREQCCSISRRRYLPSGISYRDAAILAGAQEMGCSIVYSEDHSHGQKYGSVMVANPFVPLARNKMLAEFPSAMEAMKATLEIQRKLKERTAMRRGGCDDTI